MRPRFVALFAFAFAGAAWEVFEFSMDQLFGTNMKKPMLGDESGIRRFIARNPRMFQR